MPRHDTSAMLVLCAITAGCAAPGATVRSVEPIVASAPELSLAEFTPVIGTTRFRARLVTDGSGVKGKGGYFERSTHNMLFVDSETGAAQWLLPDDDHEIVRLIDLPASRDTETDKVPLVVTVALVKPRAEDMALAVGRLFVFTPAGDRVVEVASDVREVSAATLDADTKLSLVYERQRRFVVAQIDLQQLTVLHAKEVAVPPLR